MRLEIEELMDEVKVVEKRVRYMLDQKVAYVLAVEEYPHSTAVKARVEARRRKARDAQHRRSKSRSASLGLEYEPEDSGQGTSRTGEVSVESVTGVGDSSGVAKHPDLPPVVSKESEKGRQVTSVKSKGASTLVLHPRRASTPANRLKRTPTPDLGQKGGKIPVVALKKVPVPLGDPATKTSSDARKRPGEGTSDQASKKGMFGLFCFVLSVIN